MFSDSKEHQKIPVEILCSEWHSSQSQSLSLSTINCWSPEGLVLAQYPDMPPFPNAKVLAILFQCQIGRQAREVKTRGGCHPTDILPTSNWSDVRLAMSSDWCGEFRFLRDAGGCSTPRNLPVDSLAPLFAGLRWSFWRFVALRFHPVIASLRHHIFSILWSPYLLPPFPFGPPWLVRVSQETWQSAGFADQSSWQDGRACWQCLVPQIHIYPSFWDWDDGSAQHSRPFLRSLVVA